jgi:hypothetical protein
LSPFEFELIIGLFLGDHFWQDKGGIILLNIEFGENGRSTLFPEKA